MAVGVGSKPGRVTRSWLPLAASVRAPTPWIFIGEEDARMTLGTLEILEEPGRLSWSFIDSDNVGKAAP